MIGDKVLVKVLSQIPDTYTIHTWTAEDYLRDLLQVKPIELTPDILEKNKFIWTAYGVIHGGEDITLVQSGDYWNVKPNQLSNDIFCSIWYVHELQHALRLCGLETLADNFKVN